VPQLGRVCAQTLKLEYVLGVAEELTLGCVLQLRRTEVALLQGTLTLEGATCAVNAP
jgi:hypothetical protein